MTVLEAVNLFKMKMMDEVFQSSANEDLQSSLIDAVKRVEEIVVSTYEAERKSK